MRVISPRIRSITSGTVGFLVLVEAASGPGERRAWNEVPASTVAVIRAGEDELHAFAP